MSREVFVCYLQYGINKAKWYNEGEINDAGEIIYHYIAESTTFGGLVSLPVASGCWGRYAQREGEFLEDHWTHKLGWDIKDGDLAQ